MMVPGGIERLDKDECIIRDSKVLMADHKQLISFCLRFNFHMLFVWCTLSFCCNQDSYSNLTYIIVLHVAGLG